MKPLLFAALRLLGVNRLFRRLNRGRIKVLMYHHVTPDRSLFDNSVTPDQFERQLRHLKRHYNVMGMSQDGRWEGYDPDRVNVLVTFDDGFVDIVEGALPILQRVDVPAVFFIIAECARSGAPPDFARKYGGTSDQLRTVGRAEIRHLLEAGMTIGSHSLSHRDFRALDERQALDDARGSRLVLEELCGEPVATFAFPWGYCTEDQKALMTGVYERVFLTDHGFCSPEDKIIPRNEVATPLHLEAAASGALDFVRRLLAFR
jgi:peptidoglycan/xylan/chitin deacetylase (PgdA/CDA1 family)